MFDGSVDSSLCFRVKLFISIASTDFPKGFVEAFFLGGTLTGFLDLGKGKVGRLDFGFLHNSQTNKQQDGGAEGPTISISNFLVNPSKSCAYPSFEAIFQNNLAW